MSSKKDFKKHLLQQILWIILAVCSRTVRVLILLQKSKLSDNNQAIIENFVCELTLGDYYLINALQNNLSTTLFRDLLVKMAKDVSGISDTELMRINYNSDLNYRSIKPDHKISNYY